MGDEDKAAESEDKAEGMVDSAEYGSLIDGIGVSGGGGVVRGVWFGVLVNEFNNVR